MANMALIMGSSGSGKSTADRNLNPDTHFIIQCVSKELPFKGAKKMYNKEKKNLYVAKTTYDSKGALEATVSQNILRALKKIEEAKHIKTCTIDDMNYSLTFEYKARNNETGYAKFEKMAFGFMDVIEYIQTMRDDLTVFIKCHTQKDADGLLSAKTVGKFLDDKVVIEGLFSVVLLAGGADYGYKFITNKVLPAKSPMGMFDEDTIDNDLALINEKMITYYNGDDK